MEWNRHTDGHYRGNLSEDAIERQMRRHSCGRGCTLPLLRGLGSEIAQRATADKVALEFESVVHGRVSGQDALGRAR